jgi:hypothetical protein
MILNIQFYILSVFISLVAFYNDILAVKWVRIRIGSRFAIRTQKRNQGKSTHKKRKKLIISPFEVLDDLFSGLKA